MHFAYPDFTIDALCISPSCTNCGKLIILDKINPWRAEFILGNTKYICIVCRFPYRDVVNTWSWNSSTLVARNMIRHTARTIVSRPKPLLAIYSGNSPVTGEFPTQRPVTQSFDVFFDLRLNKRLSKQSWGWWFETPLRQLWRHCNVEGNHSLWVRCSSGHKMRQAASWFFIKVLYISHNGNGWPRV